MAINRTSSANIEELGLFINNGDLKALKDAVARLGFKDEESMFRYLLAIMSKSATRSLTITDQSGTKISLNPSESLLKTDTPTQ